MPAVLITSANRGLGLEFAVQYLADGWHVYAACRQPQSAGKLQRLARDEKDQLDTLAMDVTNASSIKRAAAKMRDSAIDVLINSAGITGKPGQKTGNVDYVSWAQVLDVNTMGALRVTEAFVDHVARSDRNYRDHHQRHGVARRQYLWWIDCVSQFEGRGEHGDAKRGDRPCPARHFLCPRQSGLGQD